MAEIWPDAGLDLVLAIFPKNGTNAANTYLALFTTFTASTVGSASQGAHTDYTEPSGNAYARQTLAAATWGAIAAGTGGRKTTYTQVTFPTASGSWGTVNGFWVGNATSGAATVYFAANFDDTTGVAIQTNDVIKVTPTIQYNNQQLIKEIMKSIAVVFSVMFIMLASVALGAAPGPNTIIDSGPSGSTTSTSATFTFHSTKDNSTFRCSLDGSTFTTCTTPKSYTVGVGAHTFRVAAVDRQGRVDASPASRSWTVTNTPPPPSPPTAPFTVTPANPVVGSPTTFDWTGTCPAGGCTFVWEDEGPDGPGGDEFPLGTGDPYTRTFQVVGTKYIHLVVTDSQNNTAESRQQIQVSDTPPPPPPTPRCSNGLDDDQDGLTDLADPGCVDANDDDETNVVNPPPPGPCDLNATPSNFASQVSAATAGQTICLASGDYGTWTGTNKSITVKKADGATPVMRYSFGSGDSGFVLDGMSGMSGDISAGAANITVRNSSFADRAGFDGVMTNVVFDNNTHNNQFCPAGDWNMRIHLNSSGVTVKNSTLQGGDCDGFFISGNNNLVENNRIINVCESGSNHTDGLQYADPGDPSGGYNTVVRKNFFSFMGCSNGYAQALSSYDGGTDGALIEDNVIDTSRPGGIELYADEGSTVRHNTVRWRDSSVCAFNAQCGYIEVTNKSGDPVSTGTQVYDNVARVSVSGGATNIRNDHNISGQSVTFVGPLTTYSGFYLAAGSVGKGAASDGLDVGIR